jgi:hypothetical protein
MMSGWYLVIIGFLIFIAASFFIIMGARYQDKPTACVISYNSALSDLPNIKLQLEKLDIRVKALEAK